MSNALYAISAKTCHCPLWDIDVKVEAKYRYLNSNDKTAKFNGLSECDILKNLRLPKSKQDKRFEMCYYCDRDDICQCLTDFPEEIKIH